MVNKSLGREFRVKPIMVDRQSILPVAILGLKFTERSVRRGDVYSGQDITVFSHR